MVTVVALHQRGHLVGLQAVQGILVLGNEAGQLVPAHVAALLGGTGVGGVLLGGVLKGNLAVVDLIEHFLGLGLVLDAEQNVAGLLRAVPAVGHLLGGLQLGIVATLGGVGRSHSLGQLGLQQVGLDDRLDVGLLGHVAGLESLLEGLFAFEHGLGLLQGLVDVGLLDRDVVLSSGLLVQVLVHVVVDNFLANRFGGVAVGYEPLAPGLIGFQRGRLAEIGHVVGDRLLHNVLAVHRGSHVAAGSTVAAAASQASAKRQRQRKSTHALERRALHKRGEFHESLYLSSWRRPMRLHPCPADAMPSLPGASGHTRI